MFKVETALYLILIIYLKFLLLKGDHFVGWFKAISLILFHSPLSKNVPKTDQNGFATYWEHLPTDLTRVVNCLAMWLRWPEKKDFLWRWKLQCWQQMSQERMKEENLFTSLFSFILGIFWGVEYVVVIMFANFPRLFCILCGSTINIDAKLALCLIFKSWCIWFSSKVFPIWFHFCGVLSF